MIEDEGQVDHDLGNPVTTVCPECGRLCLQHPCPPGQEPACWGCLTPLPPIAGDRDPTD